MSEENHPQQEQLLQELAQDYAEYFQVDSSAEKHRLDQELETMLIRLEEYGSLLDRTRSESRHVLDELIPQIYSHYLSLQQTFKTIDGLEAVVGRVKEDVTKMEKAVSQAESHLGVNQGFATVIRPLFFMRDHPPERATPTQLTFEPPDIFKTDDYFTEPTDAASVKPSEH